MNVTPQRVMLSGLVVTFLVVAFSGCANIGTASTTQGASCAPTSVRTQADAPALPHTSKSALEDPRSLQGATTAYTLSTALAAVSADPESEQHLPVTVTSNDGPKQTVRDTSRILALNQNGGLAAAVYALGFGCQLVGRDVSTDFPGTESLPKVSRNSQELDAEAILAFHPTVVLTDTTIGPYSVQKQLRSAGVPVVFIPTDSTRGVSGVRSQITQVAKALGVPTLGQQLANRTQEEITQTTRAIRRQYVPTDVAKRPRAVFLYVRGTSVYYWFGEGSGADSLLRAIGTNDVAKEAGISGMVPANAEALVRAKPDVIIVMTLGLASVGGVDGLLALPGVAETPAGQHRRIVDMSDFQVMSFGPQTASVLAALATAVYDPKQAYQPAHPPTAIRNELRRMGKA